MMDEPVDVQTIPDRWPTNELVGPAPTVLDLMRQALAGDVDVGVLERLMVMEERVAARHARDAFVRALNAFQASCPAIPKTKTAKITTRTGGAFTYRYAPLETMVATVGPHLRDNGFTYTWNTTVGDAGMMRVTCILRHVDGHVETADFECPTDTKAEMSSAQAHGSAMTFGRRMTMEAVLGLSTTEDTDGAGPGPGVGVPGDARTITGPQEADLNALIREAKADRALFLEFMGVPSLTDIPAGEFARAVQALEVKRDRARAVQALEVKRDRAR